MCVNCATYLGEVLINLLLTLRRGLVFVGQLEKGNNSIFSLKLLHSTKNFEFICQGRRI